MLKKIVAAFLPPIELHVCDFSVTPGGRQPHDGRYSGAAYRENVLMPNLHANRKVIVIFDGLAGVASSWLNEVFAHPSTKQYSHLIDFASTDYSRIYDKISRNFLRGIRPYTG